MGLWIKLTQDRVQLGKQSSQQKVVIVIHIGIPEAHIKSPSRFQLEFGALCNIIIEEEERNQVISVSINGIWEIKRSL